MAKGKRNSPLYDMQLSAKKYMHNCAKCRAQAVWVTVDHIIPVSFLTAVGLKEATWEDGDNLQFLCKACQNLKSNRFDFTNPKTLPLLHKYVKRLDDIYQVK